MRIAVVADSHLAPAAHAFNRNRAAVGTFVKASHAELTVHLGDVTVDGLGDAAQFAYVQAISASWPTPIRYLPGNHDIGDNPPGPGVTAKQPLAPVRMGDFRAAFEPDHWVLDAEGWRLIGLNAQLFGTEGVEEAQQWAWLTDVAAKSRAIPAILLLHKPLFQDSPADAAPHHRYARIVARRRLIELLSTTRVCAVISGHTHQYCDRVVDGIRHIWVPSTAYYLPDEVQDRIGEKITGLGVLALSPDTYRFHLVCPDGVARHSALDHPFYPELLAARARSA
jgi:3',5'-cyclic AMP phosphodiesterase CpdA